ncbi:hypothetical protein HBB16_19145 [Pseudonocardia sp. MCCB 268]|nr:hypothetical protein [Pseudonocardia cytotoxica]
MYHCARLDCFFSVDDVPGRDQHHPARPGPGFDAANDDRGRAGRKLFCPYGAGSLLRHRTSFDRPVVAAQRYYGATAMPVSVAGAVAPAARRVRLELLQQTEMARCTILRPRQLERTGSAGRACSTSRPGWSATTRGRKLPAGEVRRDRPPVPRTPRSGTTATERPRRRSRATGSSGDLGVMTADGYLSVVDRKKDMIQDRWEAIASGGRGPLPARRRRRCGVQRQPPTLDRGR